MSSQDVNTDIFYKADNKNPEDIHVSSSLFTTSTPSKKGYNDYTDTSYINNKLMRLQQKFFNSDFIPTEAINYTNTDNLISQEGGRKMRRSTDVKTFSIPMDKSTSQYSTSQYSTSQYSTSQYSCSTCSTTINDKSSSSTTSSSVTNSDSDSDESLDHKKPELKRTTKNETSKKVLKKSQTAVPKKKKYVVKKSSKKALITKPSSRKNSKK